MICVRRKWCFRTSIIHYPTVPLGIGADWYGVLLFGRLFGGLTQRILLGPAFRLRPFGVACGHSKMIPSFLSNRGV